MVTVSFTVRRDEVYDEVDKTTDYTGSRLLASDGGARDRMLAAPSYLAELPRLWEETCVAANERLREMFVRGGSPYEQDYTVLLSVSVAFDMGLAPSVEATLCGFFVAMMTARWLVMCDKGESAVYMARAAELMEEVRRKLYVRRMRRSPRSRVGGGLYPWEPGALVPAPTWAVPDTFGGRLRTENGGSLLTEGAGEVLLESGDGQ